MGKASWTDSQIQQVVATCVLIQDWDSMKGQPRHKLVDAAQRKALIKEQWLLMHQAKNINPRLKAALDIARVHDKPCTKGRQKGSKNKPKAPVTAKLDTHEPEKWRETFAQNKKVTEQVLGPGAKPLFHVPPELLMKPENPPRLTDFEASKVYMKAYVDSRFEEVRKLAPALQPGSIDQLIDAKIKAALVPVEDFVVGAIAAFEKQFTAKLAALRMPEVDFTVVDSKSLPGPLISKPGPYGKTAKPRNFDVVVVDWDAKRLWQPIIKKLVLPGINVHYCTPLENKLAHATWFPFADMYITSFEFFRKDTVINNAIRAMHLDGTRLRHFLELQHTAEFIAKLINTVLGLTRRARNH